MKDDENKQSELWPLWLFLLNVGALYLGSLPLYLWSATPNPSMYLVAPFILGLFDPIALLVMLLLFTGIVVLAFQLGTTEDWWLVLLCTFGVSLAHSFLAIEVVKAYST